MFSSEQLQVYFICGTQDIPENRTIEQVLDEALKSESLCINFVKRAHHL